MNEMFFIHLSQPDYPAIRNTAMLTVQNRRDIKAIVVSPLANNALSLRGTAECNLAGAGEKVTIKAAVIPGWLSGDLSVSQHAKR